jgi:hypothetical protein
MSRNDDNFWVSDNGVWFSVGEMNSSTYDLRALLDPLLVLTRTKDSGIIVEESVSLDSEKRTSVKDVAWSSEAPP